MTSLTSTSPLVPIDNIQFHREMLDWRDKHYELAQHHLSRELPVLFSALDAEIDKMEMGDFVLHGSAYTKEHLQPHYREWVGREVKQIIEQSEADLRETYRCLAHQFQANNSALAYGDDSASTKEITAIAIAGCGALVAIPTFASWSVVSAGGIAGFFGATVISWPVVMAGVAVGGGMLAFGGSKAATLKTTVANSVKKNLRKTINKQVLGNQEQESVCQRLHQHFDDVSHAILRELPE